MVTQRTNAIVIQILSAHIRRYKDALQYPYRLLGFSPEMDAERAHTKAFLHAMLYDSLGLSAERARLEQLIGELFRFWMAHPEDLTQSYQEQLPKQKAARVICYYIAGMTDNFILREYERLFGVGRRQH